MTLPLLRNAVSAFALVSVFAPVTPALAQDTGETPNAFSTPQGFSDIVAAKSPAVVGIAATGVVGPPPRMREMPPLPFGIPQPQEPRQGTAMGSGFIVDDDGHVVTNNHVVEGASEIEILLQDGERREASVVGTDPATDLAVLKLQDVSGLSTVSWGDSDAMQPGAWTIAIGSPFGLGGTVTVGVLSATSRDIRSGPYDDFLQTDASINSGNSGGPLFNASGDVIGVNTAIFSPSGGNVGIGFAVPASTAQEVVAQLIASGSVQRGFIGVGLQAIDNSLADALGLENTSGAIVANVEPGSPAASAGLQEGDVLLSLEGEQIEDPRSLTRRVAGIAPDTTVSFTVQRDGETQTVDLTLAQREDSQSAGGNDVPAAGTDQPMGVGLTTIPEAMRRQLGLNEGLGIMVQTVIPGSAAAAAGLTQGDIITSAAGADVTNPQDLINAWNTALESDVPLLVRVLRSGGALFVAIDPAEASE
ncbi:Do family serine endopeptidase [Paracoccus liaowanqingii]|uniref:Do family serine endopeptidase n=1 Tax=Paracoccus liaowanqingii TaxID=2560053 RepID=A0A4Z1CGV6_9RHOB|nr:Do family serine endopeptidase [Paracoccus liaowanqingii]TGN61817.1 Do family serine endopeptidase [Paracoccus liaowanqingii]